MITLFLVIAISLLGPVVLFFMLFAKSIMTLDSVTIAGIVALELYMTKKVHPAFCILAGIDILCDCCVELDSLAFMIFQRFCFCFQFCEI